MIDIGNNVSIDPRFVISVSIDNIHYVNGTDSFLYIKMSTGETYKRQYSSYCDIYKLKAAIEKEKL